MRTKGPLIYALSLPIFTALASSPPVTVQLRTSWAAAPPLLEVIETIAIEEPDLFFPILDLVTNPELTPTPPPTTAKEIHNHVLSRSLSEFYISESNVLSSIKMNLALHAALPKVEAFYQFYTHRHAFRNEQGCESWVDWFGQVVCDVETLEQLVNREMIDPPMGSDYNSTSTRPKLLPIDHIYPPPNSVNDVPPRTAILYAALPPSSSSNFRALHSYLFKLSSPKQGRSVELEYVLRPIPPVGFDPENKAYLSGYGVALDLKKTEYLAVDDRGRGSSVKDDTQSEDESSASDIESEPEDIVLSLLHQYPESSSTSSSSEVDPTNWGFQAAQLLYDTLSLDSSSPLQVLKQLSQNFPKYASLLGKKVVVNDDVLQEMKRNANLAAPGVNMVWLNGNVVSEKDMSSVHALLRLLNKERPIVQSLVDLGLSPAQVFQLLTHPSHSTPSSQSPQTNIAEDLVDASDREEGGDVIGWMNDLESDERYQRWGESLSLLMQPLYPGQLPSLKYNVFQVVFLLDLSKQSSLQLVANVIGGLIKRGYAVRWGVVPLVPQSSEGNTPSEKMAKLFYWLLSKVGKETTLEFLSTLGQLTPDESVIEGTFNTMVAAFEDAGRGDIFGSVRTVKDALREFDGREENVLEKVRKYANRLGVPLVGEEEGKDGRGELFVDGKHFLVDDDLLRNVPQTLSTHLQYLQQKLYSSELVDSPDSRAEIHNYFYNIEGVSKRRNKWITGEVKIVNLAQKGLRGSGVGRKVWIYPDDESVELPLSVHVIADLDSEEGAELIRNVAKSVKEGSLARITFVHNPYPHPEKRHGSSKNSKVLAELVSSEWMDKISPKRILEFFEDPALVSSQLDGESQSPFSILGLDSSENGQSAGLNEDAYNRFVDEGRSIAKEVGFKDGDMGLIVNGRVIGPLSPSDFTPEDVENLYKYEYIKRVGGVLEALKDVIGDDRMDSLRQERGIFTDLVSIASSIISAIQVPDPSEAGLFNSGQSKVRRRGYQSLGGDYTKFEFGDNSTALFHFGVLLDPLSESAQKWTSILEWLLNDPAVYVELHVNPPPYRTVPLKRFYRFNLSPELEFDSDGNEVPSQAVFQDLPTEPIYTLAMDVPQSWLARPRESLYDLDNIQLGILSGQDKSSGVKAVFSLDYLVVEGHAREVVSNAPPRGLQLQLTVPSTPSTTTNSTADLVVASSIADTLVMANLGYIQFRTKPGVYELDIRPGRGREIFKMQSAGNEGWDSKNVDDVGSGITVTSFEGLTLYPRVERRKGMERADVLASPQEVHDEDHGVKHFVQGVVSSFSSIFSKHKTNTDIEVASTTAAEDHAEINIFTVASGLLYERFASIMILSVLRNTKSTVKFWFIENFLSPSFLEFIPHFAETYNFKYELVTYKWPSWLRAQKEKQRIIWAYKILFLDVLFPMDLKKVIFVDADQIVRADLKELVNLDLHGAPYGYTPMGDDNTEMEGFRFWKTGYWKDFLRGMPYHISALYVVDLVRFRQMAAGDILRSHYQQLSADPNSLANLDQDLPNNLQREVPIFSLPEDWLWCETWCSKDRLDRAKTIDLCQNPLTKEPKLSRARQIPEWSTYDSEIAQFARTLAEKGVIRSEIAAVDVNVLADAGANKPTPETSEKEVEPEDVAGDSRPAKDEL
ncbi:UDP-glucose:glycoprotein glucosyltransferase-domain-containing protein [Abortiporus biennis]|nr:UDP-glucose:glycoprotein glucosyltransferase-domain-containing protein [Abortiporus biennis]